MGTDSGIFSEPHNDEISQISSINITPFVDVVLVLLIIFMVTAPLLNKELFDIILPKANTGEQKIIKSLSVAVTKDGKILLEGQLTTPESLIEQSKRAVAQDQSLQVLISADADARHADVVKAIDLVRTAGIQHFAFQVEKPK